MTRRPILPAALLAAFVTLYVAHVVCQCSREPVQVRAM